MSAVRVAISDAWERQRVAGFEETLVVVQHENPMPALT
jgi:hypothetical protein